MVFRLCLTCDIVKLNHRLFSKIPCLRFSLSLAQNPLDVFPVRLEALIASVQSAEGLHDVSRCSVSSRTFDYEAVASQVLHRKTSLILSEFPGELCCHRSDLIEGGAFCRNVERGTKERE